MLKIDLLKEKRSLIVFLTGLLAATLVIFWPFLYAIILACVVAMVTYPTYSFLLRKLGGRKHLASAIMTIGLLLGLVLPTTIYITFLIEQISHLVQNLNLYQTFSDVFTNEFYVEYIQAFVADFERRFDIEIDVFGLVSEVGKKVANYFYSFSPKVLWGTAGFVFDFFIMVVTLYFLYVEGPNIYQVVLDLSPMRRTHEDRLTKKIADAIHATIYGYLVTAFVQAFLAGIGYFMVGLSSAALVLSTLVFFMSMVPVIGATGAWVPVCIWIFMKGQIVQGIFLTIYCAFVVSGIDNFLKPIMIQGRMKVHVLLVFFSLFGGIVAFGPLGILFGPVIIALLVATIQIYREEFL